MKTVNIGIVWLFASGILIAGASGWIGYQMAQDSGPAEKTLVAKAEPKKAPPPLPKPQTRAIAPEPDPLSDAEIEDLISEAEVGAQSERQEEMRERAKRWESMSLEKRKMMRKAMFTALANVDGLEEVGDAIRKGKIDPRKFNLNPEAIADRMEFYAESMDQGAIEEEVTKTLQGIVNSAREQLK